jgi:hypothetical protein
MENTTLERIEELLTAQRTFFATQQTKNIAFRITQLKRFMLLFCNAATGCPTLLAASVGST